MLNHKPLIILLILLGSVSLVSSERQTSDKIEVNGAPHNGDFLSLNITGAEYKSSIFGKRSVINIGDGEISDIWKDAQNYTVAPFGGDTFEGKIASVYTEEFVYFYIEQQADIDWIAMQWDTDLTADPEDITDKSMDTMEEGDDMWIMGTVSESDIYGDTAAIGISLPYLKAEESNDLFWDRVIVNDTNGVTKYIAYEIKRALNTTDVIGNDVVFTHDNNVTLLMASETNHKSDLQNVKYKFSLSSVRLGGDVVVSTVSTSEISLIDGGEYLTQKGFIGLIYGIVTGLILFIPTIMILKNQDIPDIKKEEK